MKYFVPLPLKFILGIGHDRHLFFNWQAIFQLLCVFSDRRRDVLKFTAINIILCEEKTMAN